MHRRYDGLGNGISLVVPNPEAAAAHAIKVLTTAGYNADRMPGVDTDLPPNHLVIITSDALLGLAFAFRRHQLRMPKSNFLSVQ